MGLPTEPVTLTPEQIAEMSRKLSELRHNVNNHLSLIVAAVELLKRKPDMAERMTKTISDQPEKIIEEVRKYTVAAEETLRITKP